VYFQQRFSALVPGDDSVVGIDDDRGSKALVFDLRYELFKFLVSDGTAILSVLFEFGQAALSAGPN